ncbi:MAG: MiaB/RimO family radical SAM methylthiotransferase [Phycisphaeraceae bacterium]|nr:MiaB/RimO family radical SAM methylthiotransferase [Phycisphaeraceae bacterium]
MAHAAVYLETFGCQMNVLDSQLVRGQLTALGYRFTDNWQAADVVLYNTCSVREHAEQKVWSRLGEISHLRKKNPGDGSSLPGVVGVIGCMAEREGRHLLHKFPVIDLLCGPGELDKLPLLIDNAMKTSSRGQVALAGNTHRRSTTRQAAEDQLELLDLSRSFDPDGIASQSAYVRITRGCNKFCTYCVVPFTRGREIHRHPDSIVDECRKLVEAGVREITLLGQTVNHYHYDLASAVTVHGIAQPQVGAIVKDHDGHATASTVTFAELLTRIHDDIPQLARLRFVTSFPRDFGDDILTVMRDRPRICRYLHLPVQSGSNRMLQAMNRGYSIEEYNDLLSRVRSILPGAELATDIICGFPGETEDDHRATAELLRRGRFKNAFIFKYSPRPGTAAADRLPDDVPTDVKKRRNNELLDIQSAISAQVHAAYVGRTVDVFIEQVSVKAARQAQVTLGWEKPQDQQVTQLSGRTDTDLIVCFEGPTELVGQIVPVRIDRAAPLTLFGSLVNEPVSA